MNRECVQMVWVGSTLGRFDRLAMKSFMANGHPVHLYAYENIDNVPEGVKVLDGNKIVPEKKIFKHENSYAAFADLFRWALLDKVGGIYSDTDVICLKPLELPYPNYIGYEIMDKIITPTIMRFNQGHYLVKEMLDCAKHPTKAKPYDNLEQEHYKSKARLHFWKKYYAFGWGETAGPDAVTRYINYCKEQNILKDIEIFEPKVLYPICWNEVDRLIKPSTETIEHISKDSYTVHLWNEIWRREGIDKNQEFPIDSVVGQMIAKYE